VDGPSGWTDYGVGDTKDMHNYPGPGMFDLMPDRISVLGEFGGLGLVIGDHTWKNEGAWGYVSDKSTEESFARYTSLMTRLSRLAGKGLAASVYTQTTDVEVENNGLLTYDRKVDKYGRANLRKLHDMVYAGAENAFTEKTIMDAQLAWLYTNERPADGWKTAEGKDGWREGKAGFGNAVIKRDNRNAKINTEWETDEIWLRRTFEWNENLSANDIVFLEIFYDQDPVIYLNGVEIARYADWNGSYAPMDIDMDAFRKAVKKGKNIIAVELHNVSGGSYFDMRIKLLSEKK
ncbi:MAG: beta-galactosidase, partial [Verrucomicrobia bacterium]|nr:beta-galactosidase [Verrucomicrobiota bacterium]